MHDPRRTDPLAGIQSLLEAHPRLFDILAPDLPDGPDFTLPVLEGLDWPEAPAEAAQQAEEGITLPTDRLTGPRLPDFQLPGLDLPDLPEVSSPDPVGDWLRPTPEITATDYRLDTPDLPEVAPDWGLASAAELRELLPTLAGGPHDPGDPDLFSPGAGHVPGRPHGQRPPALHSPQLPDLDLDLSDAGGLTGADLLDFPTVEGDEGPEDLRFSQGDGGIMGELLEAVQGLTAAISRLGGQDSREEQLANYGSSPWDTTPQAVNPGEFGPIQYTLQSPQVGPASFFQRSQFPTR